MQQDTNPTPRAGAAAISPGPRDSRGTNWSFLLFPQRVNAMLTKSFKISYAGEVEYDIRRDGLLIGRVAARYFGNSRMAYSGDYFETGILPQVGTVRWESSAQWCQFPPPDVVSLFPGFVGCRLVFRETTPNLSVTDPDYRLPEVEYQYDGPAPVLMPDKLIPEYITAAGLTAD